MSQLNSHHGWSQDILGPGFQALTLPVSADVDGHAAPTATLIRANKPTPWKSLTGTAGNADVLYIHGWSDYFFQTHLAEYWRARGARFFALDLRRYGRNLGSEPTLEALPGYVASLDVYDEEIEAALEQMGQGAGRRSRRPLILMGHSTGGLVLALWAARNPGRASALILNSPWLELQTREIGRLALSPFIETLSKYQPRNPVRATEPGFYVRSLAKAQDGEWEFESKWHPDRSFPIYPGWLSAIIRGHQTVARGLNLEVPILVLLSTRSLFSPVWDEHMKSADVVLDVAGVAKRATDLGGCATIARIDDAVHDVFLSAEPVRERAFAAVDTWLTGYGTFGRAAARR